MPTPFPARVCPRWANTSFSAFILLSTSFVSASFFRNPPLAIRESSGIPFRITVGQQAFVPAVKRQNETGTVFACLLQNTFFFRSVEHIVSSLIEQAAHISLRQIAVCEFGCFFGYLEIPTGPCLGARCPQAPAMFLRVEFPDRNGANRRCLHNPDSSVSGSD